MRYRDFAQYVESLGRFDDHVALTYRSFVRIDRTSYRSLRERTHQVANYLAERGIERGDRVMVVATNTPEWVELLLGTVLLGAVLVPVDAAASTPTVRGFVAQTTPRLAFVGRFQHVDFAGVVPTLVLDDLATLVAGQPTTAPARDLSGEDVALVVFTSGTTADPKGVVLTQGNVLANVTGILERITVTDDWRLLSVLPLSHMYEMTGTLAVLARGAGVFYLPQVTPLAIGRALVDYRINTLLAIPELLTLMLAAIRQGAADEGQAQLLEVAGRVARRVPFPLRRALFHRVLTRLGGALDLVVTGGAPIPPDVATAWEAMGVRLVQGYGLTETSPILTVNGLDDRRMDSPGRPLDNVELRIADDGEIQVRGPSVFAGYWQAPEATAAAFTDDGWFRTGDVGRLEDGWLKIQGRLKFAIVRASGLKVFPEDVELVAESHRSLKEICVVARHDAERGETVEAVVISDEAEDEVERAIREINEGLEPFQHIDGWRRWDDADFPRTRLLKIDRRIVQDWVNRPATAAPASTGVAEPTSDPLLRVVRQTLGDPAAVVGDGARLVDLGLDSLRRLNVVALLEEQLGVAIPDDQVTPTMTVGQLRALTATAPAAREPEPRPTWTYRRSVRRLGDALREGVVGPLVGHWVDATVEGVDRLDGLDGPAIFIFNHCDDFDGPVLYQSLPRRIRRRLAVATAADVMHDHRVLALIVRTCFAGFDFARSEPYRPSLEYVGDLIDRGWNVAIAPEGRLSTTGELLPFKSGIGLLAVELQVPVVPVKSEGLAGTVPLHAKWPRRHSHPTIRIGEPMTFAPGTDYDVATSTLQETMERL